MAEINSEREELKGRNNSIRKDRKCGMKYADIARKYGISAARAHQISKAELYHGEMEALSRKVRLILFRAGIKTENQLITQLKCGIIVHQFGEKAMDELEAFVGKKIKAVKNVPYGDEIYGKRSYGTMLLYGDDQDGE